jgi:hypothetical protein
MLFTAAKALDVYIRSPTWMIEDPWTPLEKEGMRKVCKYKYIADIRRSVLLILSRFRRGKGSFQCGSRILPPLSQSRRVSL